MSSRYPQTRETPPSLFSVEVRVRELYVAFGDVWTSKGRAATPRTVGAAALVRQVWTRPDTSLLVGAKSIWLRPGHPGTPNLPTGAVASAGCLDATSAVWSMSGRGARRAISAGWVLQPVSDAGPVYKRGAHHRSVPILCPSSCSSSSARRPSACLWPLPVAHRCCAGGGFATLPLPWSLLR